MHAPLPLLSSLVTNMFCSRWIQHHNYHCGLFCLGSLGQEMKHEMNSVASRWASCTVPTQWLGPAPGLLCALVIKLLLLIFNEYCQRKLHLDMSSDLNPYMSVFEIQNSLWDPSLS